MGRGDRPSPSLTITFSSKDGTTASSDISLAYKLRGYIKYGVVLDLRPTRRGHHLDLPPATNPGGCEAAASIIEKGGAPIQYKLKHKEGLKKVYQLTHNKLLMQRLHPQN